MLFKLDLQLFAGEPEPPISPISDLTGTKWIIKSNPSLDSNKGYVIGGINFTSNGSNFTTIGIAKNIQWDDSEDGLLEYGTNSYSEPGGIAVVDSGTWSNQAYRIISITGGIAATDATLIAWLLANATQVPVVDLTNTTWVINDSITTSPSGYDLEEENGNEETINMNFVSNNVNYDGIRFRDSDWNGNAQIFYLYDSQTNYNQVYNDTWELNAFKTIQITGGTDSTDPDFIVWLTNNATYQEPQPVVSITSSFVDVSVTDHEGYITLNIGGVEFNLEKGSSVLTDLTGTSWELYGLLIPDSFDYSINFTSNNVRFKMFEMTNYNGVYELNYISTGDVVSAWYFNTDEMDHGWFDNNYKTISITGGSDATNADLIAWLQENATRIS